MDVSRYFRRSSKIKPPASCSSLSLTDYCHNFSFNGPGGSIEDTQRGLVEHHLPISEYEGDIRKYRASYAVYLRSPTESGESQGQPRDPSRFIGRVGAHECREWDPPFSDNLSIPKDVLEKEKTLKFDVGYGFLSKAWGKGYATEAVRAVIEAFLKPCGFWNPPFERVYLETFTGVANARSRRVLEKIGFKLNGIHKWDGPEAFIGGAMQPPEVCVFSLYPLADIQSEPQDPHIP
jgi:RimJ/RimL family protein N-acetyltransferase